MGLVERTSQTISATFPVWLRRDMIFNNPPGQHIRTYPKYTRAEKVKYGHAILKYLDAMEENVVDWNRDMGRAVAIKLDGLIRYVWRGDLLSKKEYDEIQAKTRAGFGVLCKKRGGNVGTGSSDG